MNTWLIIGLGNPGTQYARSRHNIGFEVLDVFAQKHNLRPDGTRAQAKLSSGTIAGAKVVCAWPQTYMNRSGISASGLASWYKVPPTNIVVVYDDLDLPFGALRIRERGSAGTHNGMRSVVQLLGQMEFPRVRVGIGAVPSGWEAFAYVLGTFEDEEAQELPDLLSRAADCVTTIITQGTPTAMNTYNKTK